jgi:hypothetical protein
MAYAPIESNGSINKLLEDLASRREFQIFNQGVASNTSTSSKLFLPGMHLNGAQLFIRNFENPDTEFTRVLIKWQTGTGKSIAAIGISQEFIKQFRLRASLGEKPPTVFIISFTARETIQEDMLKYPEFGFVSQSEVSELQQLRISAAAMGSASEEARQLSNFMGSLRRRITDRSRGGYFQFYGYKEFANRLFIVTPAGLKNGFDIQVLYSRSEGTFKDKLAAAVDKGNIIVNTDLIADLSGGLLICDEIHNVYNILEPNNYGIAIQYVLDILNVNAPRAVYMSATPMTGSAAEVVDLLNLLVPQNMLPGNIALKRTDFFTRSSAPAIAPYRDPNPNKTFVYNNNIYNLNCALDIADRVFTKTIAINNIQYTKVNVVDKINITYPILLIQNDQKQLIVVDGNLRVNQAISENITELPAKILTESDLSICISGKKFSSRMVFDDNEEPSSSFIVSQLKEGAIDKIAQYAAGRVSFLLDSDVNSYPRRIFVGDDIPGVPYLKLTLCPMTPFHERTLGCEQDTNSISGLAANAYTLYDLAFPNPLFEPDAASDANKSYGLYKSGETPILLSNAPESWRTAAGVIIEKGAEANVSSGTYVISGSFLGPDRLKLYSAKFARVVEECIAAIKAGPGKIMIYHHRVRMSGVLLLQEIMKMNGFADELSLPTDNTICAICGTARVSHNDNHTYTPARFIVAHSDIDRSVMMRSITNFNNPANLQGYQTRILIGSKIIREGFNFRGIRHQFVTSLPTDYPTLVQVFGRVVRKNSHNELPINDRNVNIRVFVSTRADGRPSPELQRYIDKGREYLVIQEVERALHIYAIDGFANYDRIRTALHVGPKGELKPSLDALPYAPERLDVQPSLNTATYFAYGHGEREVGVIAAICRVLFQSRSVWTYEDLWAAVRSGIVQGVSFNHTIFDEGNFSIAIENLKKPTGNPSTMVVKVGKFYINSLVKEDGSPLLDIESYFRTLSNPMAISIPVMDYVRNTRVVQNWTVRLRDFEKTYLHAESKSTPEMSLVEYGANFHYTFIRYLITSKKQVSIDDARMKNLYRRFRIGITIADATTATRIFQGAISKDPDEIVGYVTPTAVTLYDRTKNNWYNASHADFGIGKRHRENDIVIGFVVSIGDTNNEIFSAQDVKARFKTRPPIKKMLSNSTSNDIRNLVRGAVCETRPRQELDLYIRSLRKIVAQKGATPYFKKGGSANAFVAKLDYATIFDRAAVKRFPSSSEMCDTIKLHLLALEENARAPADGNLNGIRWLYLFNDQPPTISAIIGKNTV